MDWIDWKQNTMHLIHTGQEEIRKINCIVPEMRPCSIGIDNEWDGLDVLRSKGNNENKCHCNWELNSDIKPEIDIA